MGRMVLTWLIVSVVVGVFVFILKRQEQKDVGKITWRVGAALLVGGIITLLLTVWNNLQGI